MPRTASHDDYMDDYDWFCYFPSRNFKGTESPTFNYPYIGKNLWTSQYTNRVLTLYWVSPPTKNGNFALIFSNLINLSKLFNAFEIFIQLSFEILDLRDCVTPNWYQKIGIKLGCNHWIER